FYAHEVRDIPDEVAHDEFISDLLEPYDDFPARRISDFAFRREMKLRLAIFTLFLSCWTVPALGQGCAMCYSTATATTKEGQRAISRGVMVLLVPPLGFMTLGVGMAFRYGRKRDQDKLRDDWSDS